MRPRRRQSGITLTEVTIVVASMAILMGIALPATKMFFRSFESQSGAMTLISGALSAARAMAIKHQRYAGVRFQCEYDPRGPLYARQYMVHVMQDSDIMAYGFRAIEGVKPIPLPEPVGVMDLLVASNAAARNVNNPAGTIQVLLSNPAVANPDSHIDEAWEFVDATTFTIVFSPTGKVVIHGVRVRNNKGKDHNDPGPCMDEVFNRIGEVQSGVAQFVQDDYWDKSTGPEAGLGPEASRTGFLIFDRKEFNQAYERGAAWTQYLSRLKLAPGMVYVSPYTGRIISTD